MATLHSPRGTSTASLPPLSLLDLDFLHKPSTGLPDAASSQVASALYTKTTTTTVPALTVDQAAHSQAGGAVRSESPFQFGNPPPYPRLLNGVHRPWANHTTSSERSLAALDNMDMEHDQQGQPRAPPPSSFASKDHYPEDFDYTMRRHSIAALQSTGPAHVGHDHQGPGGAAGPRSHPSLQAVKRKISHGSIVYGGQTPVESEFPEQYRSPMDPEPPKRRGSAFDPRSMAQMNLNERRDSQDSGRFVPPGPNWWDRRDSTTSVYSNASVSSMGGYTSSYSNDSKQTWPSINPQRTPQAHLADNLPPDARSFPIQETRTPTVPHGPAPYPDRRMSVPDASIGAAGAVRGYRSRSRPPSRGVGSAQTVTPPHLPQITATLVNPPEQYHDPNMTVAQHAQTSPASTQQSGMLSTPKESTTPYSRSPELRVSHKLAERKRRKEMKDLFDELRDNLPADRGMKSSKWEILSKAIDYIGQMRTQQHEMAREIEALRGELDAVRGGGPPNNHHSYGTGMGYQPSPYNVTPPTSRTSSHYPAAGPPPPAL